MSVVFNLIPIKPPALKADTVRLELLNALKKEGREQIRMLQQTTAGWSGAKPTFEQQVSLAGGNATLLVGPGGDMQGAQKWVWLNEGTRGHWVFPKRAKALRFFTEGANSTTPGRLTSQRGWRGGPPAFSKGHYVSGITARGWVLIIYRERHIPMRQALNTALEQGLKKAGWR